jgi:hypothetical protein
MLFKYPAPVQVYPLVGAARARAGWGATHRDGRTPRPKRHAPRGLGSANHGPCSSLLQVAVQVAAHVASHLVHVPKQL